MTTLWFYCLSKPFERPICFYFKRSHLASSKVERLGSIKVSWERYTQKVLSGATRKPTLRLQLWHINHFRKVRIYYCAISSWFFLRRVIMLEVVSSLNALGFARTYKTKWYLSWLAFRLWWKWTKMTWSTTWALEAMSRFLQDLNQLKKNNASLSPN